MSDIMATPPQPVNYTGLQIQPDPVGNFLKAANLQAQTGLMGAQQQHTQQAAQLEAAKVQQQQTYNQSLQTYMANPTPEGAMGLAAAFPEVSGQLALSWNQLNEGQRQRELQVMGPVAASLQNGRPDLALNLTNDHINAIQNTPGYESNADLTQELQGAQHLRDLITQDQQNGTKYALGSVYGTLAALPGTEHFFPNYVAGQTAPASIATGNLAPAQAAANIGVTQAQTRDLNSMIQNRAAQFGLDQNRLLADLGIKLRQMNYDQNAPNMAPDLRAQADQAAVDSVAHNQMAQRIGTLAQNVGALNQQGQWVSGKPEDIRAGWQNFWGTQDQVNTMRAELGQVTGTLGSFGGAGLGANDARNLQPGLPAKNADPAQIQQFLQSFQNASLRAARIADGKSSWAYSYGRLGPATQDANIGGIQVAKGTTFPQFMSGLLKAGSTAPSPFTAPNAAPGVQLNGQQGTGQPAPTFTGPQSYLNKYVGGQ